MPNILPADFDGVFRFTNFTDTEFKARWNNIEYTFPPLKTVPMIIPGATPEEVQHIRKKFAKELGRREFENSPKFHKLNDVKPGETPVSMYPETELESYIVRCLEPLPLAHAAMQSMPKDSEENYRKDRKGKNVTRPLDEGESLTQQASAALE